MPSLTHDCSIDQGEAQLRCGCSVPVLGNACVEYQHNLPTTETRQTGRGKYLVMKTVDKGTVIGCGCRHLEIATGGMAENHSHEEPIPVKKGVMILNIVPSEPRRHGKMLKSVQISMKTSKGR